jgi:hypothetical protein
MDTEEEILDYKRQKKRRPSWTYFLYGLTLLLFLYWFISGYLAWPYGSRALELGLAFLAWAAVRRFLSNPDKGFYAFAYLGGRLCLILGIYFYLRHFPFATILLWTSFGMFAAGLITLQFRGRDQTD